MKQEKILSIITISKNNRNGLLKTIKSIANQSYKDFEYIVIDGNSTDGSLEIIIENESCIDYWVSEADSGIYPAMNKGIKKSKGKYLLFLNSGDTFLSSSSVKEIIESSLSADIICWDAISNNEVKPIFFSAPTTITFSIFWYASICHQSTLIKRQLFNEVGFYNESLKLAGDWEFFVRAFFLHRATYSYNKATLSVIEEGGVSSTMYRITQVERKQVYTKNFPYFIKDYEELNIMRKSRIFRIAYFLRKISQALMQISQNLKFKV